MTTEKEKALELAKSRIEKQFGEGSIIKLGALSAIQQVDVIPTGSLSLDLALGIGGIPRGRVTEIYGAEASGKTTLAQHIIDAQFHDINTPFGRPSTAIMVGKIGQKQVAFLNRHGKGHRFSPTVVPFAANIFALKKLGVHTVISSGAVGSLREQIAPGHLERPPLPTLQFAVDSGGLGEPQGASGGEGYASGGPRPVRSRARRCAP